MKEATYNAFGYTNWQDVDSIAIGIFGTLLYLLVSRRIELAWVQVLFYVAFATAVLFLRSYIPAVYLTSNSTFNLLLKIFVTIFGFFYFYARVLKLLIFLYFLPKRRFAIL